MVVGFLGEAAWQSTPKRSKTIAAQRLSSTLLLQWTRRLRLCCIACIIGGAPLTSVVRQTASGNHVWAMRITLIAMCLGITFACAQAVCGEEGKGVLLFQTDHDWGGGTNEWWLSPSRIDQLPKWNPQRNGKPPVSVETALAAARKWMLSKKGIRGEAEEIVLRPVHPDEAPYSSVFYYRISFQAGPYGNHLTCIVLMDRTVLEPEWHDRLK
jgi:hypothetical protein